MNINIGNAIIDHSHAYYYEFHCSGDKMKEYLPSLLLRKPTNMFMGH